MKPWTFLKDLLKSFKNFHLEKFHSDNKELCLAFFLNSSNFHIWCQKKYSNTMKNEILEARKLFSSHLKFYVSPLSFFQLPPFKISAKIIRSSSKVANFRGVMTPTIVQLQKFYTLESYQLNVLFETSLIKARYIS